MDRSDETNEPSPAAAMPYAVMLPCSQEDFRDFISGLLGKPQTIERSFSGTFEVTREDIENTYHLVNQRVHQQNEATLMQFTAKIIYDDNSSVLLNSLDDFSSYSEVRPLVSVAVHLSWTFLIRFRDKKFPEKQQIELSFIAMPNFRDITLDRDEIIVPVAFHPLFPGKIVLRISHTARTWGVDIESLISGHVASLMRSESKVKRFIYRKSGEIGFGFGVFFFVLSLVGAFLGTSRFAAAQLARATSILQQESSPAGLEEKVAFIIETVASGNWPRFVFVVLAFLLVALAGSIAFGFWVGSTADNRPSSFLLLTKKAAELREEMLERRRRGWWKLALSLASGVATSFLANVLFVVLFPR